METKICSKCNIEQPLSCYHKNGFDRNGNQKYRSYCKTCANQIETERYWQKRAIVDNLRTICEKCGDTRPYIIDFHHKDKNEKEITIGQMKRGIDSLKKEIDKCVCLCANCHREFHYLKKQQGITIEEYLN